MQNALGAMTLFVADVVRDMTQKTGQKCTAIRRIYAPRDRVERVVERIRERLAAVQVGDPAREEVTMGPVATAQQLRDVSEGIGKLESCAKIVFGSKDQVEAIGRQGQKGFFLSPVLLRNDAPAAADAVHAHEVPYQVSAGAGVTGTPSSTNAAFVSVP